MRYIKGLKPFLKYYRVLEHFRGCYSNCKWPNTAISYTARNPNKTLIQVIKDDYLLKATGAAADNSLKLN
jgi:hypothetical protein